MTKVNTSHWPLFGIGSSLLFLSLFPTAGETYFHESGWTEDRVHGVDALLYGWFLVLCGCPAWLANPLMLVAAALMYFKMWSPAIMIASIAFVCSLTICFVYTPFPTHTKTENILCSGGLIWLSAIACMWTSAVVARRNNPHTDITP